MTWPSAGWKWLIFCLFGRSFSGVTHWGQVGVELQEPHWQQSSLGIPWQLQPLAPWSQEKFHLWPYKDRGRNLLLCPSWSCSQKSFAKPCLGSGGDGRRGLGTNCTWSWLSPSGFQAVHFYQDILLIKSWFCLPAPESYPALWGKSHLSHKPLVGEECW